MSIGWLNTLKRSKLSYSVKIYTYYLFLKRTLLTGATSISQDTFCITQCILIVTHGGTALIIRNSIRHYEIDKHQRFFLGHKYRGKVVEWLHYHSCHIRTIYTCNKSEKYITFLQTLGNHFITAGDYNAKHTQWKSRLILSRRWELLKAIDAMNLIILSTGKFTYWPTDSKKILDLLDFGIRAYLRILVLLSLVSNYHQTLQ